MSESTRLDRLYCRVEIPMGSRNKYEWDHEQGGIVLNRFLFASVVYPTDYGFFPETLADDGATCRIVSSTSRKAGDSPIIFSRP